MSQPFNFVGKRLARVNGVSVVKRTSEFAIDVVRPGMLYAKILYSPYPHAKITAIDTSKAEALPGVKAVITYKDAPTTALTGGAGDLFMLDSEVRFVGEEVAAVAATDEYIAEDALDLIQVTYQQLPTVYSISDALKSGAPLVHTETTSNVVASQSATANLNTGDAVAALAKSDHVIEKDGATPRQPAATIANHAAVAEWTPDGALTVWESTANTYDRRNELAESLGIPMSKVKVITPMGIGHGEPNVYRYLTMAAVLSKKAQAPVKILPGKTFQFAGTAKSRHATEGHTKVGVNNDLTMTGIVADISWEKGAYASGGTGVSRSGGTRASHVYQLPWNYTYRGVYTNRPPNGSRRGYASPGAMYHMETTVNKAAEDLGMDPLQLRLKNACVTGYYGCTSCGLKDCLTQGAAKFSFSWQPFKNKTDTGVKRRGVSVVAGSHGCGGASPKQSAVISINKDGTVQLQISAGECGMGVETVLAQITAEALGVNLDDVFVEYGSSEYPDSGSTGGSAATHNMGNACVAAAQDCKNQLFSVAAGMLGVTADKLSSSMGSIFVTADPTKKNTFKEVMAKVTYNVVGKGTGIVFPVTTPATHTQAYFAMFMEVEVDTETGEVTIVRYNYAHDIGRVINPNTCDNQAVGGNIDSFGMSLSEEYVQDLVTGIPLTVNYLDYGLYSIANVPPLDIIWIETVDPYGPFGAKGVAECSTVLPMAAVSSAVYNAIGKWIDCPITPAKVLRALGKA